MPPSRAFAFGDDKEKKHVRLQHPGVIILHIYIFSPCSYGNVSKIMWMRYRFNGISTSETKNTTFFNMESCTFCSKL